MVGGKQGTRPNWRAWETKGILRLACYLQYLAAIFLNFLELLDSKRKERSGKGGKMTSALCYLDVLYASYDMIKNISTDGEHDDDE